MKTITGAEGTQGTPEWIASRLKHFTASEAAAMLGQCKYMTRTQLLDMKKSGIASEVTEFQQKLFDKGHATEAAMLPIAEGIIGEELYPVVGSLEVEGLPLLASFDGLTMDETSIYEHKLWNDALAEWVRSDQVPDSHWPQLEQQLLVSGAEKILFMVSDGTEDKMVTLTYRSIPKRRQRLIDGWKQFARDLESHEVTVSQQAPVAAHIDSLPALLIEVSGAVTQSNLAPFKAQAKALIASVNTDLQTDQDFADAERQVKMFADAEKKLEQAKDRALSSTASIEELFRTIDDLKDEMRTTRLTLNKSVTSKKEQLRKSIFMEADKKIDAVFCSINAELEPFKITLAKHDIAGAMKNKRTIDSLRDAANGEVARCEQEMRKQELHVVKSKAILAALDKSHKHLFPDYAALAHKAHDDLEATIKARIAEHNESMRQAEERAVAKAKADAEAVKQAEERSAAKAKEDLARAVKNLAERAEKLEEKPTAVQQQQFEQTFQQPEHKQSDKFQRPEKLSEYDAGYLDGLRAGLTAQGKTFDELQTEYLRSAA